MLKDDFFYIRSIADANGLIAATIEINARHRIFEGHFPGQPVVPGVCMMEMVKEITEAATGKDIFLHKADNVKFLSVIDPGVSGQVQAQIKYASSDHDSINFEATLFKEDIIYLKFKGEYVNGYSASA